MDHLEHLRRNVCYMLILVQYVFLRVAAVVCMSSDTNSSHVLATHPPLQASTKRRAATPADAGRASAESNSVPSTEQPFSGPEVLTHINSKE